MPSNSTRAFRPKLEDLVLQVIPESFILALQGVGAWLETGVGEARARSKYAGCPIPETQSSLRAVRVLSRRAKQKNQKRERFRSNILEYNVGGRRGEQTR